LQRSCYEASNELRSYELLSFIRKSNEELGSFHLSLLASDIDDDAQIRNVCKIEVVPRDPTGCSCDGFTAQGDVAVEHNIRMMAGLLNLSVTTIQLHIVAPCSESNHHNQDYSIVGYWVLKMLWMTISKPIKVKRLELRWGHGHVPDQMVELWKGSCSSSSSKHLSVGEFLKDRKRNAGLITMQPSTRWRDGTFQELLWKFYQVHLHDMPRYDEQEDNRSERKDTVPQQEVDRSE
jgi:hypothetical protein